MFIFLDTGASSPVYGSRGDEGSNGTRYVQRESVVARVEEMKKEFFSCTFKAGMLLKTNMGEKSRLYRGHYSGRARHSSPCFWRLGVGIPDSRFHIPDPRFPIPESRASIQPPGSVPPRASHRITVRLSHKRL